MADHLRQQIRVAAAAAVTGLATTGSNVFLSRYYPLAAEHLPALCVYTIAEQSERMNSGPVRHLQRELDLVIEAVAEANDDLDNTLDAIAKEIETALRTAAADDLNALIYDFVLRETRIGLQPDKTAKKPLGLCAMTFTVHYRTRESDPTTIN